MKHGISHRKLGMTSNHRKALLKNLSRSIILHGSITTTMAKAKTIRPVVEKLITKAKKFHATRSIHHLRAIEAYIGHEARDILIEKRCINAMNRNGGYLRIIRAQNRVGDNAPMSYIGFVD